MQELTMHLDEQTQENLFRIGKALRGIHGTLRELKNLADGLEAAELEGREKARETSIEKGDSVRGDIV